MAGLPDDNNTRKLYTKEITALKNPCGAEKMDQQLFHNIIEKIKKLLLY